MDYEAPVVHMNYSVVRPLVVFSSLYALFVFCFVTRHPAFAGAGLTLDALLGEAYLGNARTDMIGYHVRRSMFSRAVDALFLIVYVLGAVYCERTYISQLMLLEQWSLFNQCIVFIGCALLAVAFGILLQMQFWRSNYYRRHPLVKNTLMRIAPSVAWTTTLRHINVELGNATTTLNVSVDRASDNLVFLTHSYCVVFTRYNVFIAPYLSSRFKVSRALHVPNHQREFSDLMDSSAPALNTDHQILFIDLFSSLSGSSECKVCTFSVNAQNYDILRERVSLSAAFEVHSSVSVQSHTPELFLSAFNAIVNENERFSIPPIESDESGAEQCIGCLSALPNAKLTKMCLNDAQQSDRECVQCNCRPLFCVECIAKYFASKQPQRHPEDWLTGKAECPTCKATFCVFDVARVE